MTSNLIEERCNALAAEARALAATVEFRESFAHSAGHLTMSHVALHGAKLAVARAKDAIDRVAAEADAYVTKEPA